MGNEPSESHSDDGLNDRHTHDSRPASSTTAIYPAGRERMNITNDLLIGGVIFLIIILFRSTLSNHKGGIIGGITVIAVGFLSLSINNLYGKLIILSGFILILISIIERAEARNEE